MTAPIFATDPVLSADMRGTARRGFLRLFFSLAVVALTTSSAAAAGGEQGATARVTGVSDGDTLHALIGSEKVRVRLAEIDAPEKGQAFGHRSEQSLRELVGGKTVRLTWHDVDRYGRLVAHVVVAETGIDVGAAQVQRGYAWVYRRYSHNPLLIAHEARARADRIGLWADAHPVEPWLWRQDQKRSQP